MAEKLQVILEFRVEIDQNGGIHCGCLEARDANRFIRIVTQNISDYEQIYLKMREGCVNFQEKDIVISFGIKIEGDQLWVTNILSSFEWLEMVEFLNHSVKM